MEAKPAVPVESPPLEGFREKKQTQGGQDVPDPAKPLVEETHCELEKPRERYNDMAVANVELRGTG